MVNPYVRELGEVVLTQDEHSQIVKLVRPYPDGSLPPGFVSLVVTAKDRLARFREGVTRVLYEIPGGYETLCIASLHTVPVCAERPGELTKLSRVCYEGENKEWWIILPGGRTMYITPAEPLRMGRECVIVLEILSTRNPGVPEMLKPSGLVNGISIHGVKT
jgi:hypothetical protein